MRPRKILLARTDRLGDVILSTPVAAALKKEVPDVHLTFLVRNYTAEILRCQPHVDEIIEIDGAAIGGDMRRLTGVLREKKFDTAIMLYPRPQLAWAVWRSGIPQRIGTGFRWYSFLFNRRVFEHRKTAARHEAEYNLRLLQPLGISTGEVEFHFTLASAERQVISAKLDELGVGARPVILHAGSGGSGRDWPPEHFAQLADLIQQELGMQVILTGVANEAELIGGIQQQTATKPISVAGRLNLTELAVLCQRAAVFVGNSSGPLHLAVMVGTPVVAFYPPIQACRPERWGPYGRRSDVLMSQQRECSRCRQSRARVCDCMRAISVQAALQKIREKLSRGDF
ncbi:MAG: glycosyltransferase family 9 protein [candidate division KSB1 bacterium]|nr:glycosyltransferase family 9 protein [candidate division KSB1 bacterium]MDZ7368692.1 glycosyltransferase family 9 protein [candidate division KSB1 bacterium]MDZ7406567.1 glycosyltransferase family 9 protein [candidate division KSB1 bacterium]